MADLERGQRIVVTFEIPGDPIAKKRPRFMARIMNQPDGKVRAFSHAYKDPKEETEESRVMRYLERAWKRDPIQKGVPVGLDLLFFMPIRKDSMKNITRMLSGELMPVKKPDLDNLTKFIKDVGRGIIYHDDSQVVHETADKLFSPKSHTRITVTFPWNL